MPKTLSAIKKLVFVTTVSALLSACVPFPPVPPPPPAPVPVPVPAPVPGPGPGPMPGPGLMRAPLSNGLAPRLYYSQHFVVVDAARHEAAPVSTVSV